MASEIRVCKSVTEKLRIYKLVATNTVRNESKEMDIFLDNQSGCCCGIGQTLKVNFRALLQDTTLQIINNFKRPDP